MASPNATNPGAYSTTDKQDSQDANMTDAGATTPGKVQKTQSNANSPTARSFARRKTTRRDLIMASPTGANFPGAPQETASRRTSNPPTDRVPRGANSEAFSGVPQQQQQAFAELAALSNQLDRPPARRAAGPPLPRLGGTLVLRESHGNTASTEAKQASSASPRLPLYQPPQQQPLSNTTSPDTRPTAPRQPSSARSILPSINIASLSQQLAAEGKPPLTPQRIATINKVLQGFDMVTRHAVEEGGMLPEHAAWTWEVIRRRGLGVEIDWEKEGRKRNEMIARQMLERDDKEKGSMKDGNGGEGAKVREGAPGGKSS